MIELGAACGPNDFIVGGDVGYVDSATLDLHLGPGSAAVDRGNPLEFPTHDIDGDARPVGLAPDAGADEQSQLVSAFAAAALPVHEDGGETGPAALSGGSDAGRVRRARCLVSDCAR